MSVCANCGEANPDRARFCLACGSPLAVEAAPAGEARKTVTILFSDLAGSTALGERLDPETLRRVLDRYFETMREIVESHGGTVEKYIGDAIMAVFGIPTLHEDDALRAVRAADEMRRALSGLNEELERDRGVRLEVRTGVHTGEVVTGNPAAGQRLVTGDAVNVAARLEQSAGAGEILLGDPTFRLVRDAVDVSAMDPIALKGKAEPVAAHRLVGVTAQAPGLARRLDSPMVGRDHERTLLAQAFDRSVAERTCSLFTVLGAAGVGKSRLSGEFLEDARGRATVLIGRCLPYGDGITYWPVREIVSQAAGIEDDDPPARAVERLRDLLDDTGAVADDVAALIGFEDRAVGADEGHRAVRLLLEELGRREPLVVVFDDVHWAEPALLDLIEHVADWSRDAPILLLCVARPELLEIRPGWGGGKMNATSILLQPLSPTECRDLIENLLGGAGLDAATVQRIVEAAEGNPLFVEQMLAAMVDDDLLERVPGGWRLASGIQNVPVPGSITALLSARLDRLAGDERAVIERASVVGRVFYRSAVTELSPELLRGTVGSHLQTLVRKELIRPHAPEFADEDTFRFLHMLIRDAAYEAMPKEVRADLHERFAAWLERAAGGREREFEEILGYHLEQAYRYRAEIGSRDADLRGLADRAAARLLASGRRARERGDQRAAATLLGRAADLMSPEDPERTGLLLELVSERIYVADSAGAEEVLRLLREAASEREDPVLDAAIDIQEGWLDVQTRPDVEFAAVLERTTRATQVLTEAGDARGSARGWLGAGMLEFWLGRAGSARRSLQRARSLAAAAGDRQIELEASRFLCTVLVWGPDPRESALAEAEEILQFVGSGGFASAAHGTIAVLHAMAGRAAEARSALDQGIRIAEEYGRTVWLSAAHTVAEVGLLLGDLEGVVEHLEPGLARLRAMGESGFASMTAGYLAEASLQLGHLDDADRHATTAEHLSAPDDVASQLMWRTVRARLWSQLADHQRAVEAIRDVVRRAEGSDYHNQVGDVLLAAAEIHRAAGLPEAAAGAARSALSRYEARNNDVGAARVRAFLEAEPTAT